MKVFERYTLEYKRSPVHQFQQRISLTCCLGFRISPRSCNAFPNPEEPGEEDEDVQAERMRTAGAVTALQMNEVVLIKNILPYFREQFCQLGEKHSNLNSLKSLVGEEGSSALLFIT